MPSYLDKYVRIPFWIVILMLSSIVFGQGRTVTGKVTDASDGTPLPGVSIRVEGTSRGTTTDMDGNYSIANVEDASVLQFSYLGYITQTITVGTRTQINIQLSYNVEELQEVVVLGYGTVRKSDLTGAVSKVESEDLTNIPSNNVLQSLQGRVAGVNISNVSGNPGADPAVYIRGISTLNDNRPLFVVDGVIIEGGANFINPNDIESIEVLKDASSLAIYGSRGSNGVIIITTKKGEGGKPTFNVTADFSLESIIREIDVMSGREFATYINEINPGTYNNLDVLPDVNWQDEIYNDLTPIQNYSISTSATNDNFRYYFSLGYFGQQGILPKSDFQRMTVKSNNEYALSENIDLGVNLSVELRDKQNPPNVSTNALWAWPINEPFTGSSDPDSMFAEVQGGGNPLAAIEYTNNNTRSIRSVGNLYAQARFWDGFTFRTSVQFDVEGSKNKSFTPEFFVAPLQQNQFSNIGVSYSDRSTILFENTLSYDKEFNENHRINAVAGYTSQLNQNEFVAGSGIDLLRDSEEFWYIASARQDTALVANNSGGHSALTSILGRVNYSAFNKYIFTFTFRRDGSSNFGANNRYGNFPSFAAGWNLSDEPFFPATNFINLVKFRTSWGITGNEKIGGGDQYTQYSTGFGAVFGIPEDLRPGVTLSRAGNTDLKWEEVRQFNAGFNGELFNSRLTFDLDYYVKTSRDILVFLSPPAFTGAPGDIRFNAATVQNRGFEYLINFRNQSGPWSFEIGTNGSTIRNEVLGLGEDIGADSVIINGFIGLGQSITQTVTGFPIGFYYGYDVIGVFQTQEEVDNTPSLSGSRPGDFIFRDVNNDGVINSQDRVKLGNSIPTFVYGFNLNVGYKQFRLETIWNGQAGSQIYNGKQTLRFAQLNYEGKFNNYWRGPGSTNEHPRPTVGGSNFRVSDYFLEDASYLRLRTVTLSYALTGEMLTKLKLSNANIYLRGTNLLTFTRFTGYSPDLGTTNPLGGVNDPGVYPITRVYSIGLNLSF